MMAYDSTDRAHLMKSVTFSGGGFCSLVVRMTSEGQRPTKEAYICDTFMLMNDAGGSFLMLMNDSDGSFVSCVCRC